MPNSAEMMHLNPKPQDGSTIVMLKHGETFSERESSAVYEGKLVEVSITSRLVD